MLGDYEIQESDREGAARRKSELQQKFKEMAQQAFGQFATEARELERRQSKRRLRTSC